MPGTITHLIIADKIYHILGDGKIKNLPLFFGGNIAPDAIHAKKDYQRADKKRSHLCDGIRTYGYGYPEVAKLFQDRIDEFIKNYYLSAGDEKDLYLGYVIHLLADELYLLEHCRRLEERLNINEAATDISSFRRALADKINNGEYTSFFTNMANDYDISVHEHQFNLNVSDVLEAAWDYEVRDYINASEVNASKRWVIQKYFKSDPVQENVMKNDRNRAAQFADCVAGKIVEQIRDII